MTIVGGRVEQYENDVAMVMGAQGVKVARAGGRKARLRRGHAGRHHLLAGRLRAGRLHPRRRVRAGLRNDPRQQLDIGLHGAVPRAGSARRSS